jgi:hypothetical protein
MARFSMIVKYPIIHVFKLTLFSNSVIIRKVIAICWQDLELEIYYDLAAFRVVS